MISIDAPRSSGVVSWLGEQETGGITMTVMRWTAGGLDVPVAHR